MRSNNTVIKAIIICWMLLSGSLATAEGESYVSKAIHVKVEPLADIEIYPKRTAPASVVTLNDSMVAAQITGTVKTILVGVGQRVKKNDLLVSIDCSDHRTHLERMNALVKSSEARLTLAKSQLRRVKALMSDKYVPENLMAQREAEFTQASADIISSKVQVKVAALAVNRCKIRAPFDAVVMDRKTNVGELASPGVPLLRLIDVSRLQVSAEVNPRDVSSLERSKVVNFSYRDKEHVLRLRRVNEVISFASSTQQARFNFYKKDNRPAIGAEGYVTWESRDAHILPRYIVRRNEQLGVFVVQGDMAKFMPLVNADEGRPAKIKFAKDTPIIVKGYARLNDGDIILAK